MTKVGRQKFLDDDERTKGAKGKMEEIKQGWKKRVSWLLIAITVVVVYKMLDNFSSIQAWFGTLFTILKPFLIGLLIA